MVTRNESKPEVYFSSGFHVDTSVVFQSMDPFIIFPGGYRATTVIQSSELESLVAIHDSHRLYRYRLFMDYLTFCC